MAYAAWTKETARSEELFIQRITDLFLADGDKYRGHVLTKDFNHDPATFAKYCDMQARSMYASGFNGKARVVETCALDVRRHFDLEG